MAAIDMPDVFTLRCCRHEDSLNYGLQNLLLDRDLVDVTLVCDGGEYVRAHKVVLASCSNFFKTVFNDAGCKHPTVVMPDIKMTQLQAILEFIYTGEVNVSEKEILEFFHASEMLKVNGLTLLLHDENLQLDKPLTPETTGVEEVVVAEICESVPYSEPKIKQELSVQKEDKKTNEDPLGSICKAIPSPLLKPSFCKPESVDYGVRRSFRKRTRSVRAPSPESILRGSGFGPYNPLVFHEEQTEEEEVEKEKLKVEHIEMKEESSNVKENVQQIKQNKNQQDNDCKVSHVQDKNIPSSHRLFRKFENTVEIQAIKVNKGSLSCRYKCPLCPKSYSYKPHVLRHFKFKHKKQFISTCHKIGVQPNVKTPSRLLCSKCPRTFDRRSLMEKHILREHSKRPAPKIKVESTTKEDTNCESKENVKRFQCEQCSKSFEREENYKKHVKEHPNNKIIRGKINIKLNIDKKNICRKCNKKFSNVNHLTQHINAVHKQKDNLPLVTNDAGSTRVYKCTYCNKQYSNQSHVYRHISNIHGKFAQPVTCRLCNKVSQNLNSLKSHTFVNHPGHKLNLDDYL